MKMRIPEIYYVVFMISFSYCILMFFTAFLGKYSFGPLQFSEDLVLVSVWFLPAHPMTLRCIVDSENSSCSVADSKKLNGAKHAQIPKRLSKIPFLISGEKKVTGYSAFGNLGCSLPTGVISRKAAVMHKC